jgi:hypothetical protein
MVQNQVPTKSTSPYDHSYRVKNWGINKTYADYSARKCIAIKIKIYSTISNSFYLTIRSEFRKDKPELMKGKMKKKLRESPMRELTVSELIAHTGSPCVDQKHIYKFTNCILFTTRYTILNKE